MRLPRFFIGLTAATAVLAIGCGAAVRDGSTDTSTLVESPASVSDATQTVPVNPVVESPLSTVEIVRRVNSSVVRIDVDAIDVDEPDGPVPTPWVGTGLIIDSSGLIITNNHVVAGDDLQDIEIVVTLSDARQFPARIVGTDPPRRQTWR